MSKILFVCTANICRSPAAEAIARTRYGAGNHLFSSAGFLFEGREATPEMIKTLGRIDVDASSHRSRIITEETGLEADLILTMESRHLQDLAVMSEALFVRTIPLAEAAELLSGRWMSTEEFRAGLTGRSPQRYLDTTWDVDDPYKRSRRRYRKAVEEISSLVDSVVRALET
jgi:protein-tyrosine-phosphatase